MRRFFTFLGLLAAVLITVSFFGPATDFLQTRSDLAAAEEQLREAERQAEQSLREYALSFSADQYYRFEQATAAVPARLDAHRVAQERHAASWARLQTTLTKWTRVFAD